MDLCLRASFPHSGDFFDASFIDRGSDLAHSVVWNDGEVFYLVGSSGGNSFDRQCPFPFPDQSYCELDAGPLGSFTDQYDGMIARFDMRTIDVAVSETHPHASDLVVFPSPAADLIRLSGPEWMNAACSVRITDVSGRVVLEQRMGSDAAILVRGLAAGSYVIQVEQTATSYSVSTRFIKQ
ncbi:MAG: T9SS type A sorting domain-containing protein [Flavobacteriales bacterium]